MPVVLIGSVILGLLAGVFGGLFGIGGGLVIVPALILGFGFDIKTANGTSMLAQLLPVGILAVVEYGRRGEMSVAHGLGIAAGLVVGTLIGARLTGVIPPMDLKRYYGMFLIVVGLYFLIGGPQSIKPRAAANPPASADQVH